MANAETVRTRGVEVVAVCFVLGGALGYVIASYLPQTREGAIWAASVGTAALVVYTYFANKADHGNRVLYLLVLLAGAAVATVLTLS